MLPCIQFKRLANLRREPLHVGSATKPYLAIVCIAAGHLLMHDSSVECYQISLEENTIFST